ncbi:glutathione peroxidase [Agaribacterium haliotis]|uniref:glutathione peroxidase n=1 Tax=Agaribacterium haliotis TaxID=2013869 RepID=UPI000BB58F50|nr:glutathione peroxidase [Agaribacterium haliotis]
MKIHAVFKSFSRAIAVLNCVQISAALAQNTPDTHETGPKSCPELLQHSYRKLHSKQQIDLCELYQGKAMLIVNTASHCGFTKQFGGLEQLNQDYKDRGLVIVGFASDSFNQESADELESFGICYGNYGVTFTMLAATDVKGANANPTFVELSKLSQAPSWNFNKYLVSADGLSVQHFGSMTKPDSDKFRQAIDSALAQ